MSQRGNADFRMALGKRARGSQNVRPIGLKINWEDYPPEVREALNGAEKVYYPSILYEEVFRTLGKQTFPCNYYRFMGNKILQTQLFQLLEIPHPRTRLFYGRNRLRRIEASFAYPLVAKTPVGASGGKGVFLVESDGDLRRYLDSHQPAYIQEYLPMDRNLRVVVIGGRVVHAYWRINAPGDFRSNVAQGASIRFDGVPREGVHFAVEVAYRCGFDEVGLDVCRHGDNWFVLEANMVYGLEGFRRAGLDLYAILGSMLDAGLI